MITKAKTTVLLSTLFGVICFIVTLILYPLSVAHITNDIADRYVETIEKIYHQVQRENLYILGDVNICQNIKSHTDHLEYIKAAVLFNERKITCASDLTFKYVGQALYDLEQPIALVSSQEAQNGREIAVLTQAPDGSSAVVSIIDINYIRARTGHLQDDRVKNSSLTIGGRTTSPNPPSVIENISAVSHSSNGRISVFVESSKLLNQKQRLFYAVASVPITLVLFGLAFAVKALCIKHTGLQFELKRALQNNEFLLHYQPQHNTLTGKVFGVEALVRWRHPNGVLHYPNEFIPRLERLGLINKLTDQLFDIAYRDFKKLGVTDIHLGINVPSMYFQDEQSKSRIIADHKRFSALGVRLGLELTERQLLDYQTITTVNVLKEQQGIEVLIDDFGTGQTSLSVLQDVKLDYLKIDKCFVNSIGTGSVNASVLDAIINLASLLGVQTIAEGVETHEQAEYLAKRNVTLHQGYLYAKPRPLCDIAKHLPST